MNKGKLIETLLSYIIEEYEIEFHTIKIIGVNDENKTIETIELSVDDIFVNDLLLKTKEILDKLEEITGYCIRQRKLEF